MLSTLSNGRGEADRQSNFGMMVKTLPLIITLKPGDSAAEYVRRAQQSMFDTMENDAYPFTRISENYHFSPEIMYAYQSGVLGGCTLGGERGVFESLEMKTPKFKLSVHIEEDKTDFYVCAQYNDALYTANLMRTFARGVALAPGRS